MADKTFRIKTPGSSLNPTPPSKKFVVYMNDIDAPDAVDSNTEIVFPLKRPADGVPLFLEIQQDVDACSSALYHFYYGYNPSKIAPGKTVTLYIVGGVAPFTWAANDANYTFNSVETTTRWNTLTADETTGTGDVTVTITDSCGNTVIGVVHNSGVLSSMITSILDALFGQLDDDYFTPEFSSRISQLELDVADIPAVQTSLSNANSNITNLQNLLDIITGRVDSNDIDILANQTDITVLQATVSDPNTGLAALAIASDVLDTRIVSNDNEITVNSTAITSLDSRLTIAEDDIVGHSSAIAGLNTRVIATEDDITAISDDIVSLEASISNLIVDPFDSNSNYAINELVTYNDLTYRCIQAIVSTPAPVPTNTAYWEPFDVTEMADLINANASALNSLDVRVTYNEGVLSSHSSDLTGLDSRLTTSEGDILGHSSAISVLQTDVTNNAGNITTNASDIDGISSVVNDPVTGLLAAYAAVQSESITRASEDSALASDLDTVQTTVDGHTASIQINTSSINGLETEHFVKFDINGYISGFGIVGQTDYTEAVFYVDKFKIINPGESPVQMFAVGQVNGVTTVGIRGDLVIDGSILTRHLGAIELDAEVITTGILTGIVLSGNTINVTGIDGLNVLNGANINLSGSDSNPGSIIFESSTYDFKIATDDSNNMFIHPSADGVGTLYIGTNTSGTYLGSSNMFNDVNIFARDQLNIWSEDDIWTGTLDSVNDYSGFINIRNTAPQIAMYVTQPTYYSGIYVGIYSGQPYMRPMYDNDVQLGTSSSRWKEVWAADGTINTSDEQQKVGLTDSDLGLDFIKLLTPKKWKWPKGVRTHYGLSGQDVENAVAAVGKTSNDFAGYVKELLHEVPDEVVDNRNINAMEVHRTTLVTDKEIKEMKDVKAISSRYTYGLRTHELIGPVIKAIQELSLRLDNLEQVK